jgi:hypothetical protein
MNQEPAGSFQRRSEREWRARLLVAVGGLFLFETVSGFLVWLAPFSVTNQFMVLTHTAGGVAFLAPFLWYAVRHYLLVRPQPVNHYKVLGWSAAISILACSVSGAVLTWQAAFGTRIGYVWDQVHIYTGIASLAFVLLHAGLIVARNARLRADFGPALRRAESWASGWSGAAAAAALLATAGAAALHTGPDFTWSLPEDYVFKYGPNPFAPSLARTATGGAYHPASLAGSEGCGRSGCHEEIYREWLPSAHRYAAMDPGFQAIQAVMAENEGAESTRYCAGCHDPIALFSGKKNLYSDDLSFEGAQEGVSCVVCHSIVETDVRGNAHYAIVQPRPYAFERSEGPAGRFLSGLLIRAYPARHVEDYARDLYRTPEYCGACHKQFIDQEINKVGWVQLQNQYDNWKASPFNKPGRLRESLTCRECHMRLTPSRDPARGDAVDFNRAPRDGRHRNHRFIAANQFVPRLLNLPGHEEHARLTEAWLRGETVLPEIADRWSGGPIVPIKLVLPDSAVEGEPITVRAVVTNRKVGHDFPTGPLDIIQAWVELTVADEAGREVFHSGRLNAENFLEKGAFIFKAEGIDQYGNLIDRHNLWEMVGARFRRALFPGMSDTDAYTFRCPSLGETGAETPETSEARFDLPAARAGRLTVTARILYRKFDQFLLNYMFDRTDLTAPVTEMSRDTATVAVGRAYAAAGI